MDTTVMAKFRRSGIGLLGATALALSTTGCGGDCVSICELADDEGCEIADDCEDFCDEAEELNMDAECEDDWDDLLACIDDQEDVCDGVEDDDCEDEGEDWFDCAAEYCIDNPEDSSCGVVLVGAGGPSAGPAPNPPGSPGEGGNEGEEDPAPPSD